MNNIDLFEFTFIDRKEQRKKVDEVFCGKIYKNIIWVYGKHGVGKSYFINHIIADVPDENVVHVELNVEEQSTNCIQLLLEKLGETTHKPFISFFHKNYKVVSKLAQGILSNVVENICKVDLSSLFEVILDSSKIFTSNTNQQQNNVKLILSYIDSILLTQDLLIVIDNFSLCDNRSLDILISLLQYYSLSKKKNICFILCTSHDKSYNAIEYQLQEKIELEPIEIKPFENYKYFNDILISKFNLTTTKPHTLKQIFEFCQGYPERLKTFIHLLYSKGGVIFSDCIDRAIWKNEVVESIIYENCHEYNIKDMPYLHQFILYIIVEFQKILPLKLLSDLVNYLKIKNQILILNFSEEDIISAVLELKQNGIVSIFHENGDYYIKFEHDLKYYSFKSQFEKEPMMPKVNAIFFEYIIDNQNIFETYGYSEKIIMELLAWHSYNGKVTNWIYYNLKFGNLQYQSNNYEEAADTYRRLKDYWSILDNEQKITIGNCFFCTGKYTSAKTILESINHIENDLAYKYYLLMVRVYNMLYKKEKAIDIIENNLPEFCQNESQWLVVQNLKQRILSNIEDKRSEAKILFDYIKEHVTSYMKTTEIYSRFLMGTVEFYRGIIAEKDLIEAEKIATASKNQYLLAMLYINRGFHEFWRGNISLAKEEFQKSQNSLSSVRIHEISYPLNNLGVCYMMEGEINSAINCFQLGLLWNQSKYVEITLKTLLMSCYAIQKKESCFSLMDELLDVLNNKNITDISIHLKVNFLIGFVYKCYGDLSQYDKYREKSIKLALKYSSKSLPFIWIENYSTKIENYIKMNVDINSFSFFYQMRFEPWLVTLNHD